MNSKILYIYNLVRLILPETGSFKFKNTILNFAGIKMGQHIKICSSAKIIGDGNLIIGNNTWIGINVMILSSGDATLTIGDNVDIAPQVFIGTGTHELNTYETRVAGKGLNKNIEIGNGTWIGTGAKILPGVKIGKMCMIAAGAVVSKDVQDFSMVGGIPAKLIKIIDASI